VQHVDSSESTESDEIVLREDDDDDAESLEKTKRFELGDEAYDQPIAYNKLPIRLHKYENLYSSKNDDDASDDSDEQVVVVELPDYDNGNTDAVDLDDIYDDISRTDAVMRPKRQIYKAEKIRNLPNGFAVDRLMASLDRDKSPKLFGFEHVEYKSDDDSVLGITFNFRSQTSGHYAKI
jgi:hypothetical protein